MRFTPLVAVALLASTWAGPAAAYYIPGIQPISYGEGEQVNILVNGIHSHQAVVPYGYYTLPFCRPSELTTRTENLGELLWGDRIETSAYVFTMNVNTKCTPLACTPAEQTMDAEKLKKFEKFIEDGYRGFLVLDNLPVFANGSLVYGGLCKSKSEKGFFDIDFLRGYSLGVKKSCHGASTLLNNHLDFRIQFNRDTGDDEFRVVGFTATPYSVQHTFNQKGEITSCNEQFNVYAAAKKPVTTNPADTKRVAWTYSVTWVEEPNIKWGSRWDTYLHSSVADTQDRVHWFSILNSLIVVVCLFSVAFVALIRALRKDFARYNAILATLESGETHKEESGWKLLFRDVLRPPQSFPTLAVVVSSGVQVLCMAFQTLVVACFGVLSPANRGGLLTTLILLYILSAFIAGYCSARLLKQFSSKSWVVVFNTAVLFPGLIVIIFLLANVLLRSVKASSAISFSAVALIAALWLLVSVPLAVLGASFGFNAEPWENPNSIITSVEPRPIPEMPWYLQNWFIMTVPSLIPLGTSFLELRFILASLWQGMVYYVFGFLSLVFLLAIVGAMLTAIIAVYYRLCAENHQWWWVSVGAPGGFGLPLMLYFAWYYLTQLNIRSGVATTLYFLYMLVVAAGYGLLLGAVGFFASYLFVRKMYGSIKLE